MGIVRFGVSMDEELLARFDELIVRQGYANRSEAIRDLVRERLVRQEWRAGEEVVGVITLVYDHHVRNLEERITDIQHEQFHKVISTMHIHLDHDHCLEVIAVKGKGAEIAELASKLIGLKGVRHGRLTATTTGKGLK
ncbi:MAG: Putative nickel-responsive regulator [Acetothermia bacterium 64_32]|nr:MAG: Putative nickel-responsive regulator [Acetothermia bacterium 64_32]MBC7097958.1 nickel-responsive transcriptional regulator NikR [Candidatus Bipolaricaulota bacterium]HAF70472.1 nickel-responsive transcriptional regulator NikR [Candidatus Acetothermia bacterium]